MAMKNNALWSASISGDLLSRIGPLNIAYGNRVFLYDTNGKQYFDAMSGAWVVNTGHGRKEIADAMQEQAMRFGYILQEGYVNEPAQNLAEKIIQMLPGKITNCLFACGGSESIESAVKAVKQFYFMEGNYKKNKILSRQHSYHGATFGAMTFTGITGWRYPFGKGVPGARYTPHPYCYKCVHKNDVTGTCDLYCVTEMKKIIQAEGADTIAAFIAEPVSMSAGTAIPPREYWKEVTKLCHENNIFIILDEIITGFGRTGRWFGYEQWNIDADIIVLGKGLTGGYAPLSALTVSNTIYERLFTPGFVHGYTYSAHPIGCAAALKNLMILEDEKLVESVFEKGIYLKQLLEETISKYSFVGEIRTFGLLGTIELVKNKETKERMPALFADDIKLSLLNHGVITRVGNQINLGPPFIITYREIEDLCWRIDCALSQIRKEDYY